MDGDSIEWLLGIHRRSSPAGTSATHFPEEVILVQHSSNLETAILLSDMSQIFRRILWNSGLFLLGQYAGLISGQVFTPEEVIINSGRPTFYNTLTSISGKIALEEHVGNSLLSAQPFVS